MIKKLTVLVVLFFSSLFLTSALADKDNPPVLNKINYQLVAQQWVKSKSALVVVAVNATQNANNISAARAQILQKLQSIAKAKWHITSLERTQNQSGLENIYLQAQVRLPNEQVGNIRQRITAASVPGMKFQLLNLNFNPSFAAIQAVHQALRARIYEHVKAELTRLSSAFPKQHYFVNNINFMGTPPMTPMAFYVKRRLNAPQNVAVARHVMVRAAVTLGQLQS